MSFDFKHLDDVASVTKLAGFEFSKYIEYLDYGEIIALRALNLRNGALDLSDIKYISKEISDQLPRSKLFKNDILLTYTGNSYGDCAIIDEDDKYHLAPNIAKISPNNVNPQYLFQIIKSQFFRKQMKNYIVGSSQPTIPMKTIRILQIPVPDKETQDKIAQILSNLDKKIEINKKINQNLEHFAFNFFREKFLEYDFNEFSFSSIKIPSDYRLGAFDDIIDKLISGDWGKEDLEDNYTKDVYCIRGADIPDVRKSDKGKMPIRFILPKNFENKKLVKNSIVIEISGGSPTQSTGRTVLITEDFLNRYDKDLICTNFCKQIVTKDNYEFFTYFYLNYLYGHDVMFAYENGTTGIKNFDLKSFINNFEIVIPTEEDLIEFNEIMVKIYKKIIHNGLENEKLTKLRDTLLPKLMSGEINVSDVKI